MGGSGDYVTTCIYSTKTTVGKVVVVVVVVCLAIQLPARQQEDRDRIYALLSKNLQAYSLLCLYYSLGSLQGRWRAQFGTRVAERVLLGGNE